MKAHCPLCGDFSKHVYTDMFYMYFNRWFWKEARIIEVHLMYCKRCDYHFITATGEGLR